MIIKYIIVLLLTYLEYFIFWFFLEYRNRITWDNIKFWLKYTPFVCLFFFLIDDWIIATMIYTTFSYPYLLMGYCIKNVNKNAFGINKILINTYSRIYSSENEKEKKS
jgi:hypothetical protein